MRTLQEAVSMVRVLAIRRARARIVSAGTPVMPAAHSAFFGTPSLSPKRYGRTRSKPAQYFSRKARSCRSSLTSV
jgi:hypothetical protein